MNIPRSPTLLAALALFSAAAQSVRADDSHPLPPSTATITSTTQEPTFSLDFSGGTIAQFLTMLSVADSRINIIADQINPTTNIPAFTVRNIKPQEAMSVLGILLRSRGIDFMPVSNSTAVMTYDPEAAQKKKADRQFFAQNLTPFLDSQTVDDIVDAIRTACALDPTIGADALQIKYHPGTKLLLVSGPSPAIDIFLRVMNSLAKNSTAKAPTATTPAPPSNSK